MRPVVLDWATYKGWVSFATRWEDVVCVPIAFLYRDKRYGWRFRRKSQMA
ncbi:hypothetical protein DE4576_00353 [Mycobacterium marinum]|uniref:Uncharacterized protein n=1 Tax=Mycobacterium marinum TaxID=1781 RepID=A0A3E2MQI9_MYCMR|nr:hypothetical protein DAVIS_04536 [Mycobacterium marinum]RFZ70460.1 hypothetical protein DE4576_00353 [Mycobacterium marinum]